MASSLARQPPLVGAATLLAVALLSSNATAGTWERMQSRRAATDLAYAEACVAYKGVQMPAADKPSAASLARVADDCNSEDYYYGVNGAPDFAAARACAIKNEDPASNPYRHLVLAMLYANGQGVARNLPLAISFVCREDEGSSATSFTVPVAAMAAAASGRSAAAGVRFDACEWGPTPFNDHCAAIRAARDSNDRKRRLDAILSTWPPADRSAFQRVVAANAEFSAAAAAGEVDRRGTSRNSQTMDKEGQVESSLVTMLESLERSTLPAVTEVQLLALDARLNATYRALSKSSELADPSPMDGAVTFTGVRNAQRAWLRYRDAWLAFAGQRFPQVPKRNVLAQLTLERARQLTELGP